MKSTSVEDKTDTSASLLLTSIIIIIIIIITLYVSVAEGCPLWVLMFENRCKGSDVPAFRPSGVWD